MEYKMAIFNFFAKIKFLKKLPMGMGCTLAPTIMTPQCFLFQRTNLFFS